MSHMFEFVSQFVSQFVNNSAMCKEYFSVMIYAFGFQWLRIHDSTLRSSGLIPGQELGSHMLCDMAKINNNNAKVIQVFSNVFSVYLSVYISLLLWL